MATGTQIIALFEAQVSDVTELSSSEELDLLNRIYNRICSDRPWEFLKTNVTGSLAGSGDGGMFISVPSDFGYIYDNALFTDNSIGVASNATPRVVFLGTSFKPYQLVNYGDRIQYRLRTGYCYFDFAASKIFFTGTPPETTYSMDYIKTPVDIFATTSPIFPSRFHPILAYGMATDNSIMQLSPKATSYAAENQAIYAQYLLDLQFFNAQLQQN